MKKDEKILSQEMIDFCEKAITESKKICDEILDTYKGKTEEKILLNQISKMIEIDNTIKQKINTLSFHDTENDITILDEVEEMLKRKFTILKLLKVTDEKQFI
jgi:hypothetical protein